MIPTAPLRAVHEWHFAPVVRVRGKDSIHAERIPRPTPPLTDKAHTDPVALLTCGHLLRMKRVPRMRHGERIECQACAQVATDLQVITRDAIGRGADAAYFIDDDGSIGFVWTWPGGQRQAFSFLSPLSPRAVCDWKPWSRAELQAAFINRVNGIPLPGILAD